MTRRTTLAFGAVVATAVVASLAGCTPAGPGVDRIASATFSQQQAVPDFDGSEYTQDDPAEIQKLKDLLDTYDVDPASYDSGLEPCPGSLTTQVKLAYTDSDLGTQFELGGCGDSDFDEAATDLFSQWRTDLSSVE